MIQQQTFIEWLKQFSPDLRIDTVITRYIDSTGKEFTAENKDIDVLYLGEQRLCSVPKGLGTARGWSVINDKREAGYETSDGIIHRSLSGIGIILMGNGVINEKQFVEYFTTPQNKQIVKELVEQGYRIKNNGIII